MKWKSFYIHQALFLLLFGCINGEKFSVSFRQSLSSDNCDTFTLADKNDVFVSTPVESDLVTISGCSTPVTVSVSGDGVPELFINGALVTGSATVKAGDTLKVRATSSSAPSTSSLVTVTVGDFSTNYFITTIGIVPISFSTFYQHGCALYSDQTVKCWGENAQGQLGDGTSANTHNTPVTVVGLPGAISISAGFAHTCALLSDQTAKCWGSNAWGQLGDGSGSFKSTSPVTVSGLSGVTAIKAGSQHSCALLSDQTMRCWGRNNQGQLGDGTLNNAPTPVPVSGLTGVIDFTVGERSTCALLADKTVKCWGGNGYGELGDGSTTDSPLPVSVSGLANVESLAGGWNHSCVLLADESIKCWGYNVSGQIGDGTFGAGNDRPTPTLVSGLSDVTSISAGRYSTCSVHADGTRKCWGYNNNGELGDGSTTLSPLPVAILNVADIEKISLGDNYGCALLGDNSIKCWGGNSKGQLGDGTNSNSLVPVSVIGL